MKTKRMDNTKRNYLSQSGTLNPYPQRITDELFLEKEFFDPHDLLQVKYEMIRRVRIEDRPIQPTARAFGLSRPSFYKAQKDYKRRGLAGLLPVKRGPRRAHKLTEEVMELVLKQLSLKPSLRTQNLVHLIQERFTLRVHPRTIERALARWQKKPNEGRRPNRCLIKWYREPFGEILRKA